MSPQDQLVKQCMLYIQMQFEKIPIETEEDLEQLRLAWLAILSGDFDPIVIANLKEVATLMRKMYQDSLEIMGVTKDQIHDAVWKKAEQLGKMKSGKLKKKFIEDWYVVQKLTEEYKVLQQKERRLKKKIDLLREEL